MKAVINPNNLKEARERINMPLETAAKKIGISNPGKLRAAENGESHITFKQLQKAAIAYEVSFGYFYLDKLPIIETNITDFRMNPNYYGSPKSTELIKTIILQ